jgi:hypothetical protein
MSGGPAADDLPAEPEVVDAAETVFDVVALPALTPLVRRAHAQGKQLITGAEVIGLQALEQFVLYTGVRPTDDQVRRASEFSREWADTGSCRTGRLASTWLSRALLAVRRRCLGTVGVPCLADGRRSCGRHSGSAAQDLDD